MFASPIALITGANRGIGLALARQLHKCGYAIIGTSRKTDEGSVRELAQVAQHVVQLDTSSEASINALPKQLQDKGIHHINLLINNAGIFHRDSIDELSASSILEHFTTNALGPILITTALLPFLRKATDKVTLVAQMSSSLGSIHDNVEGGMYGYRASKAALNMMNMSLAQDLKKDNITTIVIHPGYVSTDMTGGKGHLKPEVSAENMWTVLSKITANDTGKYFHHEGHIIPW